MCTKHLQVTLGEILLPLDQEFGIDPIEWAALAAEAHSQALKEITDLKRKLDDNQGTIDKLSAQLEDFIHTKDEEEKIMLHQFMELLNEKKRKIRDQQRILSTAKVDKITATAVQASREETRKAGPSRQSKRKAPAKKKTTQQGSESDADQMEIDQVKSEEQESEDEDENAGSTGAATPDRESENETDDEELPQRMQAQSRGRRASATILQEPKSLKELPPTRTLPFGKSAKAPEKQPPAPDEDDETDDDEL